MGKTVEHDTLHVCDINTILSFWVTHIESVPCKAGNTDKNSLITTSLFHILIYSYYSFAFTPSN